MPNLQSSGELIHSLYCWSFCYWWIYFHRQKRFSLALKNCLLVDYYGFFYGFQVIKALRSAFLIKAGLSKQAFICTAAVVSTFVDFNAIECLFNTFFQRINRSYSIVIECYSFRNCGFISWEYIIAKVTLQFVQKTVAILLLVLAVSLGLGGYKPLIGQNRLTNLLPNFLTSFPICPMVVCSHHQIWHLQDQMFLMNKPSTPRQRQPWRLCRNQSRFSNMPEGWLGCCKEMGTIHDHGHTFHFASQEYLIIHHQILVNQTSNLFPSTWFYHFRNLWLFMTAWHGSSIEKLTFNIDNFSCFSCCHQNIRLPT